MWRSSEVSMTRTWEHDRMSHEIEHVTDRTTTQWFRDLDRFGARGKGMIQAIRWLAEDKNLPHRLATTLAWNYFNPVTMPVDLVREVVKAGVVDAGRGSRQTRADKAPAGRSAVREGRLRRAAHTVAAGTRRRGSKAASRTGTRLKSRPGRSGGR